MIVKFRQKNYLIIFTFCGLIICGVIILWLVKSVFVNKYTNEIAIILENQDDDIRSQAYLHLIKRVGPEKAQDMLHESGLPYDGEAHFLNHTVGEYLYQTYGDSGLAKCREYFSASCYHGFLINLIAEHKTADLGKILSDCQRQGEGVFFQCSHALGHGFLAYLGYEHLIEALDKCDQTAKTTDINLTACYGGVFMENTWGLHDEGGTRPWIKPDDILFPCDDPRIPGKYLADCWDEQPTLIYKYITQDLKKISDVCQNVVREDYQNRCFRGMARLINPMTQGSLTNKLELCRQLPEKWVDMCLSLNAATSYGQGDRQDVFRICDYVLYGSNRVVCLKNLVQSIHIYAIDRNDEERSCQQILDAIIAKQCSDEIK